MFGAPPIWYYYILCGAESYTYFHITSHDKGNDIEDWYKNWYINVVGALGFREYAILLGALRSSSNSAFGLVPQWREAGKTSHLNELGKPWGITRIENHCEG